MKTLLLMCFAFLCSPIMANEAYWYGTITFNKDFKESTTTTFKPGESYYPGTQLDSIKKSWFGEMRFLPEKKVVVSARFNAETILDRKTTTHGPCPWADGNFEEHDFEYSETKINFSNSWETSGDIKINVEDDGSYSTDKTATGGMSLPEATELYTRREFYVGCRSNPLTVDEQSVALPGEMEAVGLEITGKAKPDAETLSGKKSIKDSDGGKLNYSWELTRSKPALVARISGPSIIERTDTITLDASRSTGDIKKYTWEFITKEGCMMTPEGAILKLKGPKVSFKVLCDFKVYLDVENEEEVDSAKLYVMVTPRKGDKWKTSFKTQVGPPLSGAIVANGMQLGVNQCSLHLADSTSGHYIHTEDDNTRTWRDSGYKLSQIKDQGPFQGLWYVESQDLKVDRTERINKNLLPGGEIHKLNVANNNTQDIVALVNQIQAHEKTHSNLLSDELKGLGTQNDAAVKIEQLVLVDENLMQVKADQEVRAVNTLLYNATSEENVKNRLRASGFTKSVNLWVPRGDGSITKKDMGPLWSIGDN